MSQKLKQLTMQEMPKRQIGKIISCAEGFSTGNYYKQYCCYLQPEGSNNIACDADKFMAAFADISALIKRGEQRI